MKKVSTDWSDEGEPVKSKTQLKHEMHELQQLGAKLCDMNSDKLARIPLPSELLESIQEMSRIKSHEARRRQLQFIGKLMRASDHQAIKNAYEELTQVSEQHVQQQHLIERWRDELIEGGDAKTAEFVDEFANADRQHLRQLIRAAQQEATRNKPPTSARKLFRYIRELMNL